MSEAYLYAVRCNFTDPAQEAAWNAWYGGAKMDEMLGLPHFISVQRYEALALDTRRKYLALWRIATPAAMESREYRAQWGFAQWTSLVGDWSRDLYRGPAEIDAALDVQPGEALYYAAFEGDGSGGRDDRARMARERPHAIWLEAIGLDRRAVAVGVAKHPESWRPAPLERAPVGFSETLLRPISARRPAKLPIGRVGS
jgi:hypothetical protein